MPEMRHGRPMSGLNGVGVLKTVVLVILFAAFSMQIAMLRGQYGTQMESTPAQSFYDRGLSGNERARPNLRIAAQALGETLEAVARALRAVVYLYPERSAFYRGTPWPQTGERERLADGPLVPVSVYFLFVGVTLVPILLLAIAWYATLWQRVLLLALAMAGISGWHPVAINLAFNAGALFADWPRSYYLFYQPLFAYDFVALGCVGLMTLYCARRARVAAWEIVAIVVAAHLVLEYLGVVFAAGLAAVVLFDPDRGPWPARVRAAGGVALVAGTAFVATFAAIAAIFYLAGNVASWTSAEYATYVRTNFAWFRTIIANMVSMVAVPFPIGLAFGALSGWFLHATEAAPALRRDACAAAGMLVAYFAVFAVGFLNLSYPSEMGRQFAPVVMLSLFLGVRAAEMAVVGYRLARPRG
jgi:hypothetical protein